MKAVLGKFLLVGLSLGFVLLLTELGLRALSPIEFDSSGRLYVLDPEPGFSSSALLPNARARLKGASVETNSHGLRGPERPLEKPAGSIRIAIFGDSFTFGFGVENEQTLPRRLEQRLRAEIGPEVEVMNFGIAGMNSFEEFMYYSNVGVRFSPDLVLLVWVPWDHDLENYRYEDLAYFLVHRQLEPRPERPDSRDEASTLLQLYQDYVQPLFTVRFFGRRLKGLMLLAGININPFEARIEHPKSSEGDRLAFDSMKAMKRVADENGSRFAIVIFPGMQGLESDHYQDQLYEDIEAFAAQSGIESINLFPAFRGQNPDDLHISFIDPHPNGRANGIASDALFEAVAPEVKRLRIALGARQRMGSLR